MTDHADLQRKYLAECVDTDLTNNLAALAVHLDAIGVRFANPDRPASGAVLRIAGLAESLHALATKIADERDTLAAELRAVKAECGRLGRVQMEARRIIDDGVDIVREYAPGFGVWIGEADAFLTAPWDAVLAADAERAK